MDLFLLPDCFRLAALLWIFTHSVWGFWFFYILTNTYLFSFFFKQLDYQFIKKVVTGISSGDFHLDFWLSADGSDLLDNFRRTVQVNESLVDPHLESIPSLRTFTVSSFPRSYSQRLGRHLNRSFHLEILFLRASDQVSTHLLQRLHSAAGEGDPNPVNGHLWLHGSLAGIFKGPGCGVASWLPCSSARENSGDSGAAAGGTELRCRGNCVFLKESVFLIEATLTGVKWYLTVVLISFFVLGE